MFYIFGLILIIFSSVSAARVPGPDTDITFPGCPPIGKIPAPMHFVLLENQTSYNITQENADAATTIDPYTLGRYFTTVHHSFIFHLNKGSETKKISVPHRPSTRLSLIMIVEKPSEGVLWSIHIPYRDDTFRPSKGPEYVAFLTKQAEILKKLIHEGTVTPGMPEDKYPAILLSMNS